MALPRAFDALLDEPCWVAWNDEGGRKVPKSPFGGNARSNDPSTWGTYDEAAAAASRNGYSGVGLMLSDGYIGIDLDGAVDADGNIEPWAQEVIDELGSYAERSPSGRGIHVLAWADMDQVGPIGRADHGAGIEVYNHGRYFTVTGDEVSGGRIYDLTEDIPRFVASHFTGESPEQSVRRLVGDLASAEVKRMANKTMTDNCVRDGVRYARVPVGAETCGFCIMLASRGFVYHSERTAGELDHYHQNCDCKVIPGFPGMEVEGYDPDALYDLYSEARSRVDGSATGSAISREIENILSDRSKPVGEMSVQEMVSYLERARGSGDIVYSKPIESFVGTDDERDLSAHVALHRAGYRFEVAAEDAPEGFSNIDLVMDGEPWEIKSPDADGGSRDPLRFVEKNLRKAKRQFMGSHTPDAPVRVVFNGIHAAPADNKVRERIASEMRRHGIESVIHIRKDGSTERL